MYLPFFIKGNIPCVIWVLLMIHKEIHNFLKYFVRLKMLSGFKDWNIKIEVIFIYLV